MQALKNLRIRARLLIGFGTILALMIVLTIVAISQVNQISTSLAVVNDVNSVKQRYAINFRGSVHDRAIALRDVVLMEDGADRQAALDEIDALASNYADAAVSLDRMFAERDDVTAGERAILGDIKAIEARTLPLIETVIDARLGGDHDTAHATLIDDARPAFVDWLAAINRFIDLQENMNATIADETRSVAQNFLFLMIVATALALAVGGLLAWWIIHSVTPLRQLTASVLRLARGDLSVDVPASTSRDEVGEIIGAVHIFKGNAVEAEEMRRQQVLQQEQAEEQKAAAMERMAATVEQETRQAVDKIAQKTNRLNDSADEMVASAQKVSTNAESVSAASQTSITNASTVSGASEELTASIREITRQIEQTTQLTSRASHTGQTAEETMASLQSAVGRIGEVASIIGDIAGQTNLLALNATIESARAGEAGKGFAVVAQEVKNLATQTGQSTEEISRQIAEVQTTTQEAVDAVKAMIDGIRQIDDVSASVAAAVREQDNATSEIARTIAETAASSSDVSTRIAEVAREAERNTEWAETAKSIGRDVEANIEVLRETLNRVVREASTDAA
ncbi:methyl-accepting chemotaxis protein [Fodinicurvata sp. EGI_FJ10296]|uniref:methyl-accepting chemotaxis protein n=1 Tax=Fodinicurvata sp. EGI_FJ10296 TaxID=3231908 RepID=UPI003451D255